MEQNMYTQPVQMPGAEPEMPPKKEPHPRKMIGILMLAVVVLFISASVFFSLITEHMTLMAQEIVLTIGITGGCILVPTLIHIFAGGRKSDTYYMGRLPLNQIIPCILFGIGLCFAMQVVANLISAAFASSGYDLSKIDTPLPDMRTPIDFILVSLCIAVAPAFCEELLCRGAVMYSMRSLGMHKAALWSGLFFALMHMNLTMLPLYVALGYIFGLIAYKTRDVKSTMIVHFVYNFTIVCFSLIPAEEEAGELYTLATPAMWGAVAIFAVAAAIFLVPAYLMFRRNCDRNDALAAEAQGMTVADYTDDYNDIDAGHARFGKPAMVASYVILVLMTLLMGLVQLQDCVIK